MTHTSALSQRPAGWAADEFSGAGLVTSEGQRSTPSTPGNAPLA
jgi:hypothetical protein